MKIGDIVFIDENQLYTVVQAEIIGIENGDHVNDIIRLKCLNVVNRNGEIVCKTYGNTKRLQQNVYLTVNDVFTTIDAKSNERVKQYCEEIETVYDLLDFALNHCLSDDENPNQNAVTAYKIRAKEILGVDLA